MVTAIPGGAVIAWHHRDPTLEDPTRVTVVARLLEGDELGAPFPVPEGTGYEDIWFDMMWVEDRLMMTWQRAGNPLGFQRSQVMYREWRPEGMGPEVDITGAADGGFNGRPRIGLTDEGPRVYWHTDDDGVTLGTSEDLVWRGLGADGTWGPVTAYQEDPDQDMVRVQLVEHRGQLWAAWMANVTFYEGPDLEPHPAWDIFVAPAHLGSGPATGGTVEVRWENCEDLGDRTVLVLEGLDGPMAYGPLEVVLVDPDGNEETVLAGTTDGEGRVEFDHGYHQRGGYTLTVVLDGDAVATVPVEVGSVPDHVVLDHNFAITTFIWVVAFGLVGYLVLRRKRRA
ncbi:MAG: hypothetical protein GWN18_14530, partial [Thermoplasmata archaeon]|nr:hypothetical protein [Thermoplasmata archaeon]NIS13266.1 hypothetical protein [Thermoplasmata archaeon]NIS21161.1 hypothetical protein [Thermoplasmata archaeon]NIT78648.1 hypothetical protein [Thermoplasmata archaeon]NIU50216.1 hypothetical protein [Thermoplasmata archaeon]